MMSLSSHFPAQPISALSIIHLLYCMYTWYNMETWASDWFLTQLLLLFYASFPSHSCPRHLPTFGNTLLNDEKHLWGLENHENSSRKSWRQEDQAGDRSYSRPRHQLSTCSQFQSSRKRFDVSAIKPEQNNGLWLWCACLYKTKM